MAIIPFETRIDVNSPRWNRDAWARIHGNMDSSKERIGYCTGTVMAVRPGEAVKPFLGFQTFLATRLVPLPDGNIRRLNKEVIFYTELSRRGEPGAIIEEFSNPFTGETNRIVQVWNDPFNYTISDTLILAPEDFAGDRSKLPKIPLLFPWQELGTDTLVLSTDMHLNYPNPLSPEKWPRESSGPKVQATEMMRYFVKRKDLEDPALTAVPYVGTWHRITPWLPFMLMGTTAGHCLYASTMTGFDSIEQLPKHVVEYAMKHRPDMLSAPTEDYGPSHSSLEHYAREQQPAPVR
ncbi:hypothetical protein GPROT2_02626 [Gammaproteobacteria bacterium]|nr:DUF1838 family protein [Gammaproteobacteria bacterium]QOJ30923.1 MAG: DUF1838 family protein [Gammaproteobacteria bacterium]CAG0944444.1 hypothetical protein GPROT2_02626 [Gammaproteobacteria bacterium]